MSWKAIAVGAVLGLGFGAAAHATTLVVPGTADIFAATLAQAPSSSNGGGTLPPDVAVLAGETLNITASGTVYCCEGSGTGGTGPDGFANNPFGSGSTISNSTGSTVSGFSTAGAFPLVATFGTATSAIGSVFQVGANDPGVVVPTGATELYFGLPDASGFNGPSGSYGDNGGSFSVSVSAAPEPSTWLFMLAGVGGVGLLLRLLKTAPGNLMKDGLSA